MKRPLRKAANSNEQRRVQMLSDRARSPAMREVFPQLEQVRIELAFDDKTARAPSPQMHTLFAPARAFFRFACPCAECDGEFDLTSAVTALANDPPHSKRKLDRKFSDQLECHGVRLRDRAHSRPCSITLKFQVTAGI